MEIAAFLIIGAGMLFFFGDFFVKYAALLATKLKMSPLVIGVTIVAFGTSLPELAVSIQAALEGSPDIALGNIVGSNTANLLIVLGLAAAIFPIMIARQEIQRDVLIMVGFSALFTAFALTGTVTFVHGLVCVLILIAFNAYLIFKPSGAESILVEKEEDLLKDANDKPLPLVSLFIFIGLVGIIVGGALFVNGAVGLSRTLGIPEAVIGLTIVAIGTSLPEVITSAIAAYRGHSSIAVGNVIGSNSFNLMGIGGITALVQPITVGEQMLNFDLWVMMAVTIVVAAVLLWRNGVGRFVGLSLLATYAAYSVSLYI